MEVRRAPDVPRCRGRKTVPGTSRCGRRIGRLEIDQRRATVTWGDVAVDVSHLELEVLACLAATPGVVWSSERLHEAAWGSRYLGDRDTV
jgi:DNA-binding response OmpR family regulator